MLEIFNNKEAFLRIKPKNLLVIIMLILLVLIGLVIMSLKLKVYDNYQTKGYVTCNDKCFLVTMIPSNINYDIIYFNNKEIDYKLVNKDLKVIDDFEDKEIISINFYYNKQRLINKIKTKMF